MLRRREVQDAYTIFIHVLMKKKETSMPKFVIQ